MLTCELTQIFSAAVFVQSKARKLLLRFTPRYHSFCVQTSHQQDLYAERGKCVLLLFIVKLYRNLYHQNTMLKTQKKKLSTIFSNLNKVRNSILKYSIQILVIIFIPDSSCIGAGKNKTYKINTLL